MTSFFRQVVHNEKLASVIKQSEGDQVELIATIRKSEELQKSAVAALLEGSDARSWKLARQMNLIESKLAQLTQLELTKKRLEMDEQIVSLSNFNKTL